jgi:hypothetical protein
VGTAKQAQMVMGLSEYELLRAQMGMGMGIPAHSGKSQLWSAQSCAMELAAKHTPSTYQCTRGHR